MRRNKITYFILVMLTTCWYLGCEGKGWKRDDCLVKISKRSEEKLKNNRYVLLGASRTPEFLVKIGKVFEADIQKENIKYLLKEGDIIRSVDGCKYRFDENSRNEFFEKMKDYYYDKYLIGAFYFLTEKGDIKYIDVLRNNKEERIYLTEEQ